jgi:hypothetical protein
MSGARHARPLRAVPYADMTRGRLVVHAHFYQPMRVDPFTGERPPDPSAAPYRDWNARITAECYRPNALHGALARASWDLGPTLSHYLADAAPEVLAGFAKADGDGGGRDAGPGIAQAFHHSILPYAPLHDRRTEIRWGLRDFEVRIGRPATTLWFPETAVDLATLRVAAEMGVSGTILAPWQADTLHLEGRAYRVDLGGGHHLAVAFYDADLSGAVSFDASLTSDAEAFARHRVAPRLASSLADGSPGTVVIASDGELYGHHQHFRDLFLRALVDPAPHFPDRGFDVVTLAALLEEPDGRPHPEIRIRERTSWSCHHGVLRWGAECPDAHDGRWKAPLRGALDRLAGAIDMVTDAFSAGLPQLDDVWAARDGYVDVVLGLVGAEEYAAACLGPKSTRDERGKLAALLEAQRWRLAMFASDGWYWEDPTRPETAQNLLAAARAARIVDGLAGTRMEPRLVADLSVLRSPATGIDGSAIYRHALAAVGQPPPAR